jgi:hypothetical protein
MANRPALRDVIVLGAAAVALGGTLAIPAAAARPPADLEPATAAAVLGPIAPMAPSVPTTHPHARTVTLDVSGGIGTADVLVGATSPGGHPRVAATSAAAHGAATCRASGVCRYRPDHSFTGRDSFAVTVVDGARSAVTVVVRGTRSVRPARPSRATVHAAQLRTSLTVAAVPTTGSISGSVTVPTGAANAVCVGATNSGGGGGFVIVGAGTPTGNYTVTGLTPDAYTVHFYGCSATSNLVEQYWQSVLTADAATPVVVTAGTTQTGINATMIEGGSISGTITVPTGSVADVCIDAYATTGGGYNWDQGAPGNPVTTGTYTVHALPPASYVVQFSPCSTANLVTQFWQNVTTFDAATPVAVTSGATSSGINAAMAVGGTITGTVTVPSGSASDVCVTAQTATSFADAPVINGATVTSGTYTLSRLPAGSYVVGFGSCDASVNLAQQYWQDTAAAAQATPVVVTAGGTTAGINATMAVGGSISGTVTVPSGSAAGVCVSTDTPSGPQLATVVAGNPAASGTYSLVGLVTGSYVVRFGPCSTDTNVLTQYWNGVTEASQATPVAVTTGANTGGINATMSPGGVITGSVSVPTGSAGDVCVSADNDSASGYASVVAGAPTTSGTYAINGLTAGTYFVTFTGCVAGSDLITQYWGHTDSYTDATTVSVSPGSTVSGIDAAMVIGGRIAGTVTVPSGSASDACVDVFNDGHGGSAQVAPGVTATSGTYTARGLPAGSYTVAFHGCASTTNLVRQYWQHTTSLNASTAVVVSGTATTSGIDATMVAGGSISGNVTVPFGSVTGLCITASGGSGSASGGATPGLLETSGDYLLTGLPTGNYVVAFESCDGSNVATQYWRGSRDVRLQTPVGVTAGTTNGQVNATLTAGGSISGTVTVPAGTAADVVCVSASSAGGSASTVVAAGAPSTSGSYMLTGLAAGSYIVSFTSCMPDVNLAQQRWQATATLASATPVNVTVGGIAQGINASMSVGARIGGTVTVPSGSAGNVCVSAYNSDATSSGQVVAGAVATSGTYLLTGLTTGQYYVRFAPCGNANLAVTYWPNTTDRQAAATVGVVVGGTNGGVNATMTAGGSISGAVTVPSGSAGDVCVEATSPGRGGTGAVTVGGVLTAGTYVVTGLPAGQYAVHFAPCLFGLDLLDQYWQNTRSAAAASNVNVTVGATTPGVDANLVHKITTSLQLTSSGSPTVALGPGTLTLHISTATGAPTGTAGLLDVDAGAVMIATAVVTSGDATFPTSSLAPGAHTLRAIYFGDADHLGGLSLGVSQQVNFTDVPTDGAFSSDIYWLTDHRITGGFADGSFRPFNSVARQGFAAFLYRYAHGGADAGACAPGTSPFSDVADSNAFCGDITWLVSTGITTGYQDGTFRPNGTVARQAIAAFFYRFNHGGIDAGPCPPGTSAFNDVLASNAFCGDIKWLASTTPLPITAGFADGGFHPTDPAVRQAIARYFHRYDTDFPS